ncbi:UNVERIFIED_CONTAM: hypothetical protein GTU68_061373 [Idotea baltica]|nr:hypothetical protein [Idotea baltica]
MTDEIQSLIADFFFDPITISIAVSGTPLDNITQSCYPVENFYTKVNLLEHLVRNKEQFTKVLVFVSSKRNADRLYNILDERLVSDLGIIHANKSQNFRIKAIEKFNSGENRILVATDVMARGLDLENISHVINIDTPAFPENYMHRIGRTGRAEKAGKSILFYTQQEQAAKEAIESLMNYSIPELSFPEEVEISKEYLDEERPKRAKMKNAHNHKIVEQGGGAFHEKSEKNSKVNQGGSYRRKMKKKYKKSQTRGDKGQNKRK